MNIHQLSGIDTINGHHLMLIINLFSVTIISYSCCAADVMRSKSVYQRLYELDNREFADPNSTKILEDIGQCAVHCHKNSECFAVTFHQHSKECHLFNYILSKNLTSAVKPGSTSLIMTITCETPKRNVGYGLTLINPFPNLMTEKLSVYCDQTNGDGGWMIIQRRINGEENFTRPFLDYENGFGNRSGEYWIGNKYLHLFTKTASYKLRVDLWSFDDKHCFAEYSTFSVGDTQSQYALDVNGYTGTCKDSLRHNNGQKFYTYDNDTQEMCSDRRKGGWRFNGYNNCIYTGANLNGEYFNRAESSMKAIVWWKWTGTYMSLKKAEMKIKTK